MSVVSPFAPSSVLTNPWVFLAEEPERARVGPPIGSEYVESYWTPIIGPSSVALLRLLARDASGWAHPGRQVPPVELAAYLGLGLGVGKQSPITRTMARLVQFGLACWLVHDLHRALEVYSHVYPLSPSKLRRLPLDLQDGHAVALAAAREAVAR
jgi:hypothetical protein